MNIQKRHTEHPFTITPNELINHPTLSAEAKFLVIYIESKPATWKAKGFDMRRALGKYDPEKQARKPIGRDKFSKIMKELVLAGYAELKHVRSEDNSVMRGSYYEIGCQPIAGKSGSLKIRDSENQGAGKPSSIVNKESLVNKENKEKTDKGVNLFQKFLLAFQVQQNANLSTAWVKLSDQDKKLIEKHLPEYIKRTAPKGAESPLTWRKTPLNYLKGREWLNPLPVVEDQTLIDPTVLPKEKTGGKVVPSNGVRYV